MQEASQEAPDSRTRTSRADATLTIAPAWRACLEANGWRTLDDIFRQPNDAQLSKHGLPPWRERLRATLRESSGQQQTVFVKRFRDIPLGEQLRRGLHGAWWHGTAHAEWKYLSELSRAGVRVAEPVAFGEEMAGCWEKRSAVVLGMAAGISLERWCAGNTRLLPPAVLHEVAVLVAKFHALGLAHRDLYLSHIFGDGLDTAAPQLTLIDLQRVVRLRGRRRWLVKDLAALHHSTPEGSVSPRDRLRWFKRYLHLSIGRRNGLRGRLERRERRFLHSILARARQMRRHDARKT